MSIESLLIYMQAFYSFQVKNLLIIPIIP